MSEEDFEAFLKKAFKGGILIFLGMLLARFSGFMRQFIVIRVLSPEQYGLIALGLSFLNVLVSLANLGLYHGTQRYISYYEALNNNSMVTSAIYTTKRIVAVSGILLTILIITFADRIALLLGKVEFKNVLILFSLMMPVVLCARTIFSFFLGYGRADIFVFLKDIVFGLLSILIIYISLQIYRSVYSAIIAFYLAYIVLCVVSLFMYRKIIYVNIYGIKVKYITKELMVFSLPLFFSGISLILLNNADTIMLGYFLPSESVGTYNAAFLLMQLTVLYLDSFAMIILPIASGMIAEDKQKGVKTLYQGVTKWIYLLTFPMIYMFLFFPGQTLKILFSESYMEAQNALVILVIAEFIHTALGPSEQSIIAYGATKFHFLSYLVALISDIILNLILIPRMGINGAAIATGLSLIILNLCFSFFLYFKFKVHPFGMNYIVTLIGCIILGGMLYLPLKYLVDLSPWFAFSCYPIFLAVGILITLITKSYSEEDLVILRAIRNRARSWK
jgi:O-antigen/teichoic acid export membrane protein